MKTAVLKQTPGSSGLRFEVHSMPTRGTHGVQKWYVKANHPVEASRWLQALNKSIEWARREAERASVESEVASLLTPSQRGASGAFSRRSGGIESSPSSYAGDDAFETGSLPREPSGDDHEGEKTEASSMGEAENTPPHSLSFELQGNSTLAQMELTSQMLDGLQSSSAPPGEDDVRRGLTESVRTVQAMLTEYVSMVRDREEWYREKLSKERERQTVWEESLQAVVKEGELMERELRTKSRRRSRMVDSGFVTAVSEMGTIRSRPSQLALASPPVVVESPQPTASVAATTVVATLTESVSTEQDPPLSASTVTARQSSLSKRGFAGTLSPGVTSPAARPFSLIMGGTSAKGEEDEGDTDEEDEFFDAIESGNLPNLVVNESLTGRSVVPLPAMFDKRQYSGYEHLRPHLAITSDDRPPMSLWAVLKNSIGKDLTKISFPVFFNEPTSMLQRMVSRCYNW